MRCRAAAREAVSIGSCEFRSTINGKKWSANSYNICPLRLLTYSGLSGVPWPRRRLPS
jgi:hypothetical protein